MREAVVPYVAAASLRLGVECLVGLGLESLCCAFLCSDPEGRGHSDHDEQFGEGLVEYGGAHEVC